MSKLSNEINMAEAAAARREARRKRILENSHNRLQFISGKSSNEDFSVASKESTNVSPIPHIYENSFAAVASDSSVSEYSTHNGGLGVLAESPEPLLSRHGVASGDREMPSILADLISSAPPAADECDSSSDLIAPEQFQVPLWKSLVMYKYDIVLLSLFLQILHGLSAFRLENSYFFVPLITYSITKMLWLPNQNNSSIANILMPLMLLNGMSSNGLQKMLNILQLAGTFSQDACIFLFTTISIQALCNLVIEKFVT